MTYRLLHMGVLLLSHIPLRFGQFLGKMIGLLFSMIPLKRTYVALDNIQKSLDDLEMTDGARRLNRRVLMHFGQMLFEVPHIMRLNHKNLHKYVVFDSEERLLRAMEHGNGVLGLTGHFGNWELMAAAISIHFGPGAVLVRPIDFRPMDQLIYALRSRFGAEVIAKGGAMRRVLGVLKEKKIVGILLDQNVDWYEGVFVDFLGRQACTNKGLALLALKTNAPVIPTFSVRQRDGRYRIIFENEVNLVRTGDKTRDVEDNTALFTGIIERYIRRYPDHWFWFHKRWKTKPYCLLPS